MHLFSAPTPNGWKVSILLEELREAGVELPECQVEMIELHKGGQFSPAFTRINPNQKIPALVDGDVHLMESCAILQYLAEKYPSALLPLDLAAKFDVLQWVYWQAANVGPVFGNKLSYTRYMDEVDAAAKAHPLERFGKEAQRLMRVLSGRLEGRPFVCGSDFSLADIALYPWVRGWKWSKVPIVDIPHLPEWLARVRGRPGVARGLAYGVPASEIDQWSEARKAQVAAGGSVIASNAAANRDPQP